MPIERPRELFLRELGVLLEAEHEFLRSHEDMRKRINHRKARAALSKHINDTKQQILNLTMVFDAMNEDVLPLPSQAAQGITREYREGMQDLRGSPSLGVPFVLGTLLKAEGYEVNAYQELISQAEALGERQAAQLLKQNLEQEQEMERTVERLLLQVNQELAKRQ